MMFSQITGLEHKTRGRLTLQATYCFPLTMLTLGGLEVTNTPHQGCSNWAPLTCGSWIMPTCEGPTWSIAGCPAALACIRLDASGVSPHPCDNQQCLQTLSNVLWGQNHLQLNRCSCTKLLRNGWMSACLSASSPYSGLVII